MSSYYGTSTALSSLYTPRYYSGTYTPSYQYKYSSSTLPSRARLGIVSDYSSYKLTPSSVSTRIPLGIRATSETPSSSISKSDKLSSRFDGKISDRRYSSFQNEEQNHRPGLVNLGNTCFMNSVLQCLCHTQPLIDYCIRDTYQRDINYSSPSHGDLIKVFADFIKNALDADGAISPHKLRSEVQRYAPRFMGNSQQDAHEFLRYLLQGLHDDINRVKSRSPSVYNRESFRSWRKHPEAEDSLIVDLFAGQLKSTLKCTSCSSESVTYDSFWDLSLPIIEVQISSSLRLCLSTFTSPEVLDGDNKAFCEVCKKKNRSTRTLEIHRFPRILVIHLKRFSSLIYGQKLNTMVDCPLVLRNVSEFASKNCIGKGSSYQLFGVIDHIGTHSSGHYIAKCKNPNTKEWDQFDDARVTKATDVVTDNSYIFFYIRD